MLKVVKIYITSFGFFIYWLKNSPKLINCNLLILKPIWRVLTERVFKKREGFWSEKWAS